MTIRPTRTSRHPADVGRSKSRGDNDYEITVVAWDEDLVDREQDVTIRVADSNDVGDDNPVACKAAAGMAARSLATLNDPDDSHRRQVKSGQWTPPW